MSLIKLKNQGRKYWPVSYCERCKKPITLILSAMLFTNEIGGSMVCHKATCDPGSSFDSSIELKDVLAYLVSNYMGVDMKIDDFGFSHIEVKPPDDFAEFVEELVS